MSFLTLIVILSILFQLASAILAMRLIRTTRSTAAWLFVALAIGLMAVRRIESLVFIVSGDRSPLPDLVFEVVGLVTSAFMLAGIYRIRPLFETIVRSKEEISAAHDKLSILAEERATLIADLQDAMARIKSLKGLLPICASCKKVRDDQGYWNQIEVYVSEHSDAEFSHGICPDCAHRLYPDLADKIGL